MRIGLLHSTIREDEKLLIDSARKQNTEIEILDVRGQVFNLETWQKKYDCLLLRCISATAGIHASMFFEHLGLPVVSSLQVIAICENKFLTSLKLRKNKVPTVPFVLALSEHEAIEAVNQLGGYPVVLKPVSGSWGRLLAKINDQDALEAVIEQKNILGSPAHKALYIQKYINTNGRDIRVTTVGNRVICAIYRDAYHWITNTARGARASVCKADKTLEQISLAASQAVGGGVLGIDMFETDDGYIVNEVNHTPEFKNVQRTTGVNVAKAIIDYCYEVAHHD